MHVVALDTSLSMQREGVWARAQEQAREIAGSIRGGDRVMLVAADHRLRVLQEPVFGAQRGVVTAAIELAGARLVAPRLRRADERLDGLGGRRG